MSIKRELETFMPEDIAWLIEEKRLEQIEKDARVRMNEIIKILSFDYYKDIKNYGKGYFHRINNRVDYYYYCKNMTTKSTYELRHLYGEEYTGFSEDLEYGKYELIYDYGVMGDMCYAPDAFRYHKADNIHKKFRDEPEDLQEEISDAYREIIKDNISETVPNIGDWCAMLY